LQEAKKGKPAVLVKTAFACAEYTRLNRILAYNFLQRRPDLSENELKLALQDGVCSIWREGTQVRVDDHSYGTVTCVARLDTGGKCHWLQDDAVQMK
jgi:hypothetical protein